MRQGQLLVEDNPMDLLRKYSSTSLEEVFLKVCHMQEHLKVDSDNDSNNNDSNKPIDSEESASLITNHNSMNHNLEEVRSTTSSLANKLVPTCQIFEMANSKHDQPFGAGQQHNAMGKFHEFFIDNYNKTKSQIKKSVVKTQRNLGKSTYRFAPGPSKAAFAFVMAVSIRLECNLLT